jgi:RNA recognition motif-containing protein
MQIFIGNLSRMATSRHLADLFHPFGAVMTSKIIRDDLTGHSLGFGFIEMDVRSAKLAIQKLDRCLFMNSYVDVKQV